MKDATTDRDQIRRWWSQSPDANIGIATGSDSGLFVLDLDGPDAEVEVARLESIHGPLPSTPTARTGRGKHLYFRWDDGRAIKNKVKLGGVGIDVRGDGGYVVAPPSVHATGSRYQWDTPPERVDLAAAPDWLTDFVSGGGKAPLAPATDDLAAGDDVLDLRTAPGVGEEGRHDTALRLVGAHLGRGEDPFAVLDLANAWGGRCHPPMDRDELYTIVKSLSAKDAAKLEPVTPRPEPEWPVMGEDALYGLAGDIARRLEPHTEADVNAILAQMLAYAGNAFGRRPHYLVESTRHHTSLFVTVVGETGKGRKGTGGDRVRALFGDDIQKRTVSGLGSGEGLIHQVRDPIFQKKTVRKGGVAEEREELVDPGAADKRAIVYETEFANTFNVMQRDGNTLSGYIRQAWDSGTLSNATKNSPLRATDAHITIIGHITREELAAKMSAVDGANGFANRFLWVLSRRSKLLPFGGDQVELADLTGRLNGSIEFGSLVGVMNFDDPARDLWAELYTGELSRTAPGLAGKITNRGEPQVLRLAMVYALLDRSGVIRLPHLKAAVAVWRYCEQSARYIFGDRTGDPVADKVLDAVRARPRTMTEVHKLFNNHHPAATIRSTLSRLAHQGLIRRESQKTGGRPSEVYVAA